MPVLPELLEFLAMPRIGLTIWGAALLRSLWMLRIDEHPWRLVATLTGGVASLGLARVFPSWGPPAASLAGSIFLFLVNRVWVRWRLDRVVDTVNATAKVPLLEAAALAPRRYGRGIAEAYKEGPHPRIALSYDMCRLPRSVLYFIVAHEVAHHLLDHFDRSEGDKWWQRLTTAAGGIAGFLFGGPLGAAIGAGLTLVPTQAIRVHWTKEQELESDAWAALWCLEHGIDPRRGAAFLLRYAPDEELGFFGRIWDTLWGTHPPSGERYHRIEQIAHIYHTHGLEAAVDWVTEH